MFLRRCLSHCYVLTESKNYLGLTLSFTILNRLWHQLSAKRQKAMFIASKALQASHEHNYHGTLKMQQYIFLKKYTQANPIWLPWHRMWKITYSLFPMYLLNLGYHRGSSLALLNLPLPVAVCLAKCLGYTFLLLVSTFCIFSSGTELAAAPRAGTT